MEGSSENGVPNSPNLETNKTRLEEHKILMKQLDVISIEIKRNEQWNIKNDKEAYVFLSIFLIFVILIFSAFFYITWPHAIYIITLSPVFFYPIIYYKNRKSSLKNYRDSLNTSIYSDLPALSGSGVTLWRLKHKAIIMRETLLVHAVGMFVLAFFLSVLFMYGIGLFSPWMVVLMIGSIIIIPVLAQFLLGVDAGCFFGKPDPTGLRCISKEWRLLLRSKICNQDFNYENQTYETMFKIQKDDIFISPLGKFWISIPSDFSMHTINWPKYMRRATVNIGVAFIVSAIIINLALATYANPGAHSFAESESFRFICATAATLFGAIYFLPPFMMTGSMFGNMGAYLCLFSSIILFFNALTIHNQKGKWSAIGSAWAYVLSSILFLPNIDDLWRQSSLFTIGSTVNDIIEFFGVSQLSYNAFEYFYPNASMVVDWINVTRRNIVFTIFTASGFLWVRFAIMYTLDIFISQEANIIYSNRVSPSSFTPFPP